MPCQVPVAIFASLLTLAVNFENHCTNNYILQICKNKTTIIVSHRVSSAKNADKIIIIDNGQIIQQGSHNQLVNQEGYYKELYYKQLSEKDFD